MVFSYAAIRIQFGSWVVLITLHTFAVLTSPSAETPVTANDVPFPIIPIAPDVKSP